MSAVEIEASVDAAAAGAVARRRSRAAGMSVAVATLLAIIKAVAGLLTNSLSLLASAVDSLTDIFASGVNFVAIRAAARPADEDHTYGHGKAEGLAGLFQAAVICASGVYLGSEAVRRLIKPVPVDVGEIAVGVMVVSMALTFVLVRYLRKVARETDSMALAADSGIRLGAGSSIRLPGDSGIALSAPADSGILLEGEGESGFPLRGDSSQTLSDTDDSGIALDLDDDSGITIESDSGIHLAEDSGIRLDAARW